MWSGYCAMGQIQVLQRYQSPVSELPPLGEEVPAAQPAKVDSAVLHTDRRTMMVTKVKSVPTGTFAAKGIASSEDTLAATPITYDAMPQPSTTTMTINGDAIQRSINKGLGQVGADLFTPISQLHFVQFAVYCKNAPVDKAPPVQGLYLIWHPGSVCPEGEMGACYIVKGYTKMDEVKEAVAMYKAAGIDCWYNSALTGAEVEIIGLR